MKMWWEGRSQSQTTQLSHRSSRTSECDFEELDLTAECDKHSTEGLAIHRTLSRGFILDAHPEAVSAFFTAIFLTSSAILIISSIHNVHKSNHKPLPLDKSLYRLYNEYYNSHVEIMPGQQLAKVIHNTFQVPYRFLEPLSTTNRDNLLSYLRTKESVKHRVLFVHINGPDFWERIRAFSDALAFAKNTDRVAIVIWRENSQFRQSFDDLFERQACSPFIVQSIKEEELLRLDNIRTKMLRNSTTGFDYAELSIREINFTNAKSIADLQLFHGSAASDVHIEATISGSFYSSFSARSDAASILEMCVAGKTVLAKQAISSVHLAVKKTADYDQPEVVKALHDDFKIPFLLLGGLKPVLARILLDKLLEEKQMGNPFPRTAWVQPQYGLGNRLRAIGSMWAYARATNRILVVVWIPDEHMNCNFGDLFIGNENLILSDQISEAWPFLEARRKDSFMMRSMKWYNFMYTRFGEHHPPSKKIEAVSTQNVYASSAYVIQSAETPGVIRTQSPYWKILHELTPHITVARLVQRGSIRISSDTMGVHVRARKLNSDVKGVHFGAYSRKSAQRTDYWRTLTNFRTFLVQMRLQRKDQIFYVAADKSDTLEVFEREFPGRIMYTPRSCDTRLKNCVQYALADVLLLSKCKNILGSYWSSYTELACRWGGARYRLAGVDFGKPMFFKE